jgi:hypothetical protein
VNRMAPACQGMRQAVHACAHPTLDWWELAYEA